MFLAIAFAAPRSGFVVWSASARAPGWAAFAGLVVPAGGLLGVSPERDDVVRAPSVDGLAGEPVPVVLPAGALPLAAERVVSDCAVEAVDVEVDVLVEAAVLVEAWPLPPDEEVAASVVDAPSAPESALSSAFSSAWLSAGA
jgi:hypothetical protein